MAYFSSMPLHSRLLTGVIKLSHIDLNPIKSEFIIFVFIHYKPGIDVAIFDL